MKTRCYTVALLVAGLSCSFAFSAGAQSPEQREANAPERIKRQLRQMRQEIQRNNLNYSVGYTKALERQGIRGGEADGTIPHEYKIAINRQAGQDLHMNNLAREKFLREHPDMRNRLPDLIRRQCSASLRKFNWQDFGKVTPAKDQENHPTCWAFAATAAFEASYSIVNGDAIDASEQFVINGITGRCTEGFASNALNYYCTVGGTSENAVPYLCSTAPVRESSFLPFHGAAWGYVVDQGTVYGCIVDGQRQLTPTVSQIKQALCEYGPLVSRMRVKDWPFFASYQISGNSVFYEDVKNITNTIGHAIAIVGWDDDIPVTADNAKFGAWRIKNSSGPDWGAQGFGWIAYDSSCIGLDAAWILAASKLYPFPRPRILERREGLPSLWHPPLPLPGNVSPPMQIRTPPGH